MKNNNDFEYSYYAPTNKERKEIENIKNSYTQKKSNVSKLNLLRKLDNKVKNIPIIISLIFGVVGTLIFGLGLTMILEWNLIAFGIIVCVVSLLPILSAYWVYKKTYISLKNKYSEEIIKLSDELLYDKE